MRILAAALVSLLALPILYGAPAPVIPATSATGSRLEGHATAPTPSKKDGKKDKKDGGDDGDDDDDDEDFRAVG